MLIYVLLISARPSQAEPWPYLNIRAFRRANASIKQFA